MPLIKTVNCSPKPKDDINDFSCYDDQSLLKLRDMWNLRHPDAIIETTDPKLIHETIRKYLGEVCSNNEACWLKQSGAFGGNVSELQESFAPMSPSSWKKNPSSWLSSLDIMKVMRQYEKAYKCFDFLGPSPIDFATKMYDGKCVWEEICNLSIADMMKKGKFKIGLIFNTDPHTKGGQHWISMFVNIRKGKIFFFDSVGDPAPKEIEALIKKIKEQGKALSPPIDFKDDNTEGVEHQFGNTECGIYSLYFIIHLLEDKFTEEYLKKNILTDQYMNKFRKVYFNEKL